MSLGGTTIEGPLARSSRVAVTDERRLIPDRGGAAARICTPADIFEGTGE